ncbi:MAG: TetR/AcrR family transcriptional regulator [Acidobacteriota bacterium]|jgi:Transcriptional regulator|nr:TetR/AcrR family transcriptional regulator [Acidobacteriota bacterium]
MKYDNRLLREYSFSHLKSHSKEKIIAAAKELFNKHGLKRVSVEEICHVAGVSKRTYYKYYSNKASLVIYIIRSFDIEYKRKYRNITRHAKTFKEGIILGFKLWQQWFNSWSPELKADIATSTGYGLKEFYRTRQENEINIFLRDIQAAQTRGEIRKDIKIELIRFMWEHYAELLKDDRLRRYYDDFRQLEYELSTFFWFGIFPWDRENVNHDELAFKKNK